MKSKKPILIGALAMASMLCACATTTGSPEEDKTTDQVANEAKSLLSELAHLGQQIKKVGGAGEAQIVCACVPTVKPDRPGGPGGPRTADQYVAIALALSALQKVADAEAVGQSVQFVAPAVNENTR